MRFRDVKPYRTPGRSGKGREPEGGSRGPDPRRPVGAGLVVALLAAGFVAYRGYDAGPEFDKVVRVPAPPPVEVVSDTMNRGQTLDELLGEQGLDRSQRAHLVDVVREFERPRYLQPGVELRVTRNPVTGSLKGMVLHLDRDRRLHLRPADSLRWDALLDSVPVTRDTIVVSGLVESSLWEAELGGDTAKLAPGEKWDLLGEISRIFQWQVDFYRELRPGDAFRVAVARKVRPDGTLRSAEILGAEFRNGREQIWAVNFRSRTGSKDGYYGLDGNSLETRFLRAPLEYRRVTSGFTRSRYHPVLRRRRAHLGIDYGAKPGTPVRATGSGVVSRAGWWGGYGRVVEVNHSGPYRTRYAHMSRIASGLSAGDRVQQGDVIGRVGSSGMATGPHLHYEFLERGRQVDPADLELPPGDPVPAGQRDRFGEQRDTVVRLLMRVDMPRPERVARRSEDLEG